MSAVSLIRTSAPWGALFWTAVVARFVIEATNAARQPSGGPAVAQPGRRGGIGSVFLLTGVVGFAVAFGLPALAIPGPGRVYVVIGVALTWLGIALRQWAVHTLGRFFTFELTVRRDQRVVTAGPYRLVRHPSYSGLLLTSLGLGAALGNWLALVVLTVPYVLMLARRIRVEEAMLREGLGAEYERYAASRKRLVPGFW